MTLIKRSHVTTLEDPFERVFRDLLGGGVFGGRLIEGKAAMRIEEKLDDHVYILRVEAPGIDPDKDVEITTADGLVHIEVHREDKHEEKQGETYRSEFRYGSFARTLQLPDGADASAIKAEYKDGILDVRVPIPEPTTAATTKVAVMRG
ncbi:MAG TPA: Hsp20/alpha crystallin family protein [Candidatus Limnocylindria bacterium]|nr:Hsp20/alpha crystallin family protein [Candidatus Limnocylindria bacterium]